MLRFAGTIKTIAAEIGGTREFRRGGRSLSDFLDNQLQAGDSPQDIGVKILEYFCFDDGQFNNFVLGVKLAIVFLDDTLGKPEGADQRSQSLKDLRQSLKRDRQILQWVNAWYK